MNLREKEFWNDHYEEELRNFDEFGDEGEVWFGRKLSRRISTWVTKKLVQLGDTETTKKILDIGCGNGFLIITLYREYKSKLADNLGNRQKPNIQITGIDFSTNSIDLSKKIVSKEGCDEDVKLATCDFLNREHIVQTIQNDLFDFMIDVGTLDAICLISDEENLEKTRSSYMHSIYSLAKTGSIFILASCNYTEAELLKLFDYNCDSKRNYELIDRIETPKLQFGGNEGSQVNCIIVEFKELYSPS